jgi:hypothetical protein
MRTTQERYMPDTIESTQSQGQYLSMAFSALGPYEKEILVSVAQRLLMGQKSYGKFQDLDNRDFMQETYEELLDGIIYVSRHLKRIA